MTGSHRRLHRLGFISYLEREGKKVVVFFSSFCLFDIHMQVPCCTAFLSDVPVFWGISDSFRYLSGLPLLYLLHRSLIFLFKLTLRSAAL